MKLTNIRKMGRYKNTKTGQVYNIHKGKKVGYGVDVIFYYKSGKRIFIDDLDYHHHHEKISN